ncbi:diacylglycerol pyrophosphate phosphatase [Scheffersomyces coipomensis]|uniref:diacylglycerol pyrophosphate phosphatase n=1 Tax=Scheffersomyces coipomensis TaxID=1788519 RepID=UPI00315C6A80
MSVKEFLFNIINYFHKDNRFNRITFGLTSSSYSSSSSYTNLPFLIKWRLTDVILVAVLVGSYLAMYNVQPFQRQFYVGDLSISHPFAERERVNGAELFLYAIWTPFTVILASSLIFTKPKYKIYNTYIALLGLFLSCFTTSVLTDILKNFIGRHRPDFLARCIPKEGTPLDVLVYAKDVCTTTNVSRLMDGFRTTPSGHSSLSFAGLFYTTLYLLGQLVATNELVGNWRTILSFIPTLGASLIALSRTEDYRHHFVDVCIGSLIGLVIASWSYFRLFPSLYSSRSYYPKIIIKQDQSINDEDEDEDLDGLHDDTTSTELAYSRVQQSV